MIIKNINHSKQFPTIYKKRKCGKKTLYWKLTVEEQDNGNSKMLRESSILETTGKPKIEVTFETKTKNKGKKNEMTPYESQFKRAITIFKNKYADGFTIDKDNTELFITPMLAKKFNKFKNKVSYPAAGQPKLDGERAIVYLHNNQIEMITRRGKQYIFLNTLKTKLMEIFKLYPDIYIDGELFNPNLSLQQIHSIVSRKKTTNKDEETISLYMFDCFFKDKHNQPFIKRITTLTDIYDKLEDKLNPYIKLVKTFTLTDENHVYAKTKEYTEKGFEGIIIRQKFGSYDFNRSINLLKNKMFYVDEYLIVDITSSEKDQDSVIFVIKQQNGKIRRIDAGGTNEYRNEFMRYGKDRYIGKYIRIKYFDKSDDGIIKFANPVLDKNGEFIIVEKDQ